MLGLAQYSQVSALDEEKGHFERIVLLVWQDWSRSRVSFRPEDFQSWKYARLESDRSVPRAELCKIDS